jgi:hypothetical protein
MNTAAAEAAGDGSVQRCREGDIRRAARAAAHLAMTTGCYYCPAHLAVYVCTPLKPSTYPLAAAAVSRVCDHLQFKCHNWQPALPHVLSHYQAKQHCCLPTCGSGHPPAGVLPPSGSRMLHTVICIGPPQSLSALIRSGKISVSSRNRVRCSRASIAFTWLRVRLW